jgi:signal transduction histidine kinase
LANAFTGRTNIPVKVTIAGEHVLSAEIQVTFYRICQEALNNIAKHANASRVEIDLQYNTLAAEGAAGTRELVVTSAEMRIRDDGLGFNPGGLASPGHYGLGMMSERAEDAGAQLTVTSRPGHGTEVKLRWPGH